MYRFTILKNVFVEIVSVEIICVGFIAKNLILKNKQHIIIISISIPVVLKIALKENKKFSSLHENFNKKL